MRGQASRSPSLAPGMSSQGPRPNRDASRGIKYSLEDTVRRLRISEAAKRELLENCRRWDCRVQTMLFNGNVHHWVQSNFVGTDRGGYSTTEFRTGIKWMFLGDNKFSSVCCHVAQ
eukprot:2469030-Karenia_brevis.AAC.1